MKRESFYNHCSYRYQFRNSQRYILRIILNYNQTHFSMTFEKEFSLGENSIKKPMNHIIHRLSQNLSVELNIYSISFTLQVKSIAANT